MNDAFAVARSISRAGPLWPLITHIGSISGGSWFSTQLLASPTLLAEVSGPRPIDEVVSAWGAAYGARLEESLNLGALWTWMPVQTSSICPGEAFQKIIETYLDKALIFPAQDWTAYIGVLLSASVPPGSVGNLTLDASQRAVLPTATLVQGTTMPVDAYTVGFNTSDIKEQYEMLLTLSDEKSTAAFTDAHSVLPLFYVAPAQGSSTSGGWITHADAQSLELREKGGSAKKPAETILAQLPPRPSIALTAAASSSFLGWAASNTAVSDLLDAALPGKKKAALRTAIKQCLPFGLQRQASAYFEGTDRVSNVPLPITEEMLMATDAKIVYRLLDGGVSENTGIAQTVGRMQAECDAEAAELICDEPPRLLAVNTDEGPSSSGTNLKYLFSGGDLSGGKTGSGDYQPGTLDFVNAPSRAIFAEAFPPANE